MPPEIYKQEKIFQRARKTAVNHGEAGLKAICLWAMEREPRERGPYLAGTHHMAAHGCGGPQ